MSKRENNWQYTEQYPIETEPISNARRMSLECGIEPVSRATAAYLSSVTVIGKVESILEIGTGVGVSALSMLKHTSKTHLTTIDIEPEYHTSAKEFLHQAGIAQSRTRLVTGDAGQILPRLNHNAYDLALIDANEEMLLDYVEQVLLIVKPGGTIIIPHALRHGLVADPTVRDPLTSSIRDLLSTVADSPAIIPYLSPAGDGVLTLTRIG